MIKLAELMCWNINDGETAMDAFIRECNKMASVPPKEILDVVHAGGFEPWALLQMDVSSQKELFDRMHDISRKTVVSRCFIDKDMRGTFPPLQNFYTYINSLQKHGKLVREMDIIATKVWNGELARKQLDARCDDMFNIKQSDEKYAHVAAEIKEIWNLSDTDIDALRYFACQCKSKDHNPSLNKSIYLFGEQKQTGKSTFARAFVTVLNADKFSNFGKYESTFSVEMGFNAHDLPLACLYNCVILDEAMPKDSRKSYGTLKSVFSSQSYNYNPKFMQPISVSAKRHYFVTSNDGVDEFVQDRFERRFYAIEFKQKPRQMSFAAIYKLIKQFCVHATQRMDWQEWYDSFEMVTGVAEKDKNEVMQEIYSSLDFFQAKTTVTVKQIANHLFKNEPTREQKKSVEQAMRELADDCRYTSNKYLFDSRKIAVKISIAQGISLTVDEDAF